MCVRSGIRVQEHITAHDPREERSSSGSHSTQAHPLSHTCSNKRVRSEPEGETLSP